MKNKSVVDRIRVIITPIAERLPQWLVLLLCFIAINTHADISNAVYQPPQNISVEDRQAALDRIDLFVEKLKQLEAEIDHSQFDFPTLLDRQDFDHQSIVTFVRDKISFEQYPGLLRGSEGTLISRAGNALDQALLLATLLNDAGFEARIVRGRLDVKQAQQLLSGIGKRTAVVGSLAIDQQAWDEKQAELHIISGGPALQYYAPLEEAPFYVATKLATNELIQALHDAGINLDETDTKSLVVEAQDYSWVESRLGPGDDWQAHHPAFGKSVELAIETSEVFGHEVPESLQHRLKIEVFIEQKLGDKLQIQRVAGPWERPVANLHGVVLSYFNQPNTLDLKAIETGVGSALKKANLFIPVLNGQLGTAFDLNGATADVEVLGLDAFGAAAIFQTVGEKTGKAANALSAMGTTGDSENEDLMVLTGHWIEYTMIKPGGGEKTHRRMIMDRLGETNRTAGQISLRHMTESELRLALTVQQRFMLASGAYSEAYAAEQVLRRLIDTGPAWQILVDYLYGGNTKLSQIGELEPSPIPHLALYRTFDMGSAKLGAQIAYRASPSLVVLRQGLISNELGFRSVDVVVNEKRVLVRGKDNKLRFNPEQAVAIGVWETAIETMAHDYFGPGNVENNTFAVFEAAKQQGIKARVLGPYSKPANQVKLNVDALGYLIRDLETGHAVVVPTQMPSGLALTGWWRVDPATGETLGMMSDGRGGDVAEYLLKVIETAASLISQLAKYANCEKYTEERTKACCLIEAHMDNVGGMAMGGLMGASLGGAANTLCSFGGIIRTEVNKMSGPKKKWTCHFFDGDLKTMIGPGAIVNTDSMSCGLK